MYNIIIILCYIWLVSLVPDKIYSSKGATADVFGVSGLILTLGC